MRGYPWTPAEDDQLRAQFAAGEEVQPLAGRTLSACHHRVVVLGLLRRRRWTDKDDARLRLLWGAGATLRVVAKEMGRTMQTTYWRAQKLGLALGTPEGYEYLTAAADRTGYCTSQLRPILAWAGVTIHRSLARTSAMRCARATHYVDPFEVDEAVAAWLRTVPVEVAARTAGLCGDTLRNALRKAGVEDTRTNKKAHWRVESSVIDRVLAGRGAA